MPLVLSRATAWHGGECLMPSVDGLPGTLPNRNSGLRLTWEVVGEHPLYHRGGTACVLASAVERRRCLRHCRRLHRAPARHSGQARKEGGQRGVGKRKHRLLFELLSPAPSQSCNTFAKS